MRQSGEMRNTYPTLVLTPRVRRAAVRGVLTTTELVVELEGVTVPVASGLGRSASSGVAPAWRRVRRIASDVALLGLAALTGLVPLA
jgi:hypothetical protein